MCSLTLRTREASVQTRSPEIGGAVRMSTSVNSPVRATASRTTWRCEVEGPLQPDPTALSLRTSDDAIPQNRKTDHEALRAIEEMYP